MTTTDSQDLRGWIGRDLVDEQGNKVGKIADLYYDDQSGQPEFCTVKTGLFGMNVSFVPLAGLRSEGDALVSPWDKSKVKDAPNIDQDRHLSQDEERQLWSYYGMSYDTARTSERGSDGEMDAGRDTSGRNTDDAMTRSEEELPVKKPTQQAGTVRLRKWVETEHEARTVPVTREEVRVEREPITDANVDQAMDGPEISEEEHEMPLYEEEVVSQKRTVPKERVRLDKSIVTDQETVEGDLQKERIEVEGDGETTR